MILYTLNYTGRKAREVVKNGRTYLVANMTIIVEGVLNGSQGALFYPRDEIRRSARDWDGTPILEYHPFLAGENVSAHHPEIRKKWLGHLRNSKFISQNSHKLRTEGWFLKDRTAAKAPRVYNALMTGSAMELSTGLFTDNEPAPFGATYNGRSYEWVARNYRPDHLAILPDQVGACSNSDGCGLNVNQTEVPLMTNPCGVTNNSPSAPSITDNNQPGDTPMTQPKTKPQSRAKLVEYIVANCGECPAKEEIETWPHAALNTLATTITANAFPPQRGQGQGQGAPEDDEEEDDSEMEFNGNGGPAFDGRASGGGSEQAGGKGTKEEYPSGSQGPTGNQRKAKAKVKAAAQEQETTTVNSQAAPRELSEREWLAQAPPSVRELVANMKAAERKQKFALAQRLVANVADPKRRNKVGNDLMKKSLTELQGLLELIPTANREDEVCREPVENQLNFAGAAGGWDESFSTTVNSEAGEDLVLALPTMNFAASQGTGEKK